MDTQNCKYVVEIQSPTGLEWRKKWEYGTEKEARAKIEEVGAFNARVMMESVDGERVMVFDNRLLFGDWL